MSSSGLSETTTYITCSSEIEPVQMIGFHRTADELASKQRHRLFQDEDRDGGGSGLHEATNYGVEAARISDCARSEESSGGRPTNIVDSSRPMVDGRANLTAIGQPSRAASPPAATAADASQPRSWSENSSGGGGSGDVARPLKSPRLLRRAIADFEGRLSYAVPTSSTTTTYAEEEYTYEPTLDTSTSKTVTKCRSMLNLQPPTRPDSPMARSPLPSAHAVLAKATSESNVRRDTHKRRIVETMIGKLLEERRKRAPSKAADEPPSTWAARMGGLREPGQIASAVAEAVDASLAADRVQPLPGTRRSRPVDRASCRVTGEILKDAASSSSSSSLSSAATVAGGAACSPPDYRRNVYTLPRSAKSHRSQLQRHFYYPHYVGGKCGARLPDEELPDPDKVRHARQLFERVLKIDSVERMLSGVRNGTTTTLPSATAVAPPPVRYPRPTPEIRQPAAQPQLGPERAHSRMSASTADGGRPSPTGRCRKTDDGSASSGVGSDASAETDSEPSAKGGGSGSECNGKEEEVGFSSEEDSRDYDSREELGKPISADVLGSIRAYGTSVTYYGGKIVASSAGYARSPMTMTIVNEIEGGRGWPDYRANRRFLFDDKRLSKYRLVKSNSCGSRLELAGTDDEHANEHERRSLSGHRLSRQSQQQQQQRLAGDDGGEAARRETTTIEEEEADADADDEERGQRGRRPESRASDAVAPQSPNTSDGNDDSSTNELRQRRWRPAKTSGGGDKARWCENKGGGAGCCDMLFEEFEVLQERRG